MIKLLFLIIHFSISHLFALSLNVKQLYMTLSSATTPGQSGPGSDGNEGVLRITGASPSDFCNVISRTLNCLQRYSQSIL